MILEADTRTLTCFYSAFFGENRSLSKVGNSFQDEAFTVSDINCLFEVKPEEFSHRKCHHVKYLGTERDSHALILDSSR